MLKCLSGFNDELLHYYLARIREISSLGDEAAIIETDKMVWEIFNSKPATGDDEAWERDDARDDLKGINQELTELRNKLKRNVQISMWEVESLRERADELGNEWNAASLAEFADELRKAKEEATTIADQAETSARLQVIDESLSQTIHNVSSVQSIFRQLKEASEFLESRDQLTDELKEKIRQGKERAAWYRAKKKLADADVAEAGGSHIKAPKLRKEAAVLLAQDWAVAFPDEEPPTIQV
jgi:DNA repair exonuclease SbcCD ATPase subunit